jgi:hypothetical protein
MTVHMGQPEWYDEEAGPMVRLYAMTAGRAKPTSAAFDLMAVIHANPSPADKLGMAPEKWQILTMCSGGPQSVADIASESDLPLGVVRVLLGDLLDDGHIRVRAPIRPVQLPDESILREVIDGLRAL